MQGISSKAAGGVKNRKKYNGIEFTDDLDVDTYDAFYRTLDPQIGRWWQIDPKVDAGYESVSPYASMYNNPIRFSDPLGDEGDDPGVGSVSWNFVKGVGQSVWGTVEGVGIAIAHPVQSAQGLGNAVVHPIETAKAIGNAVSETYSEFKNGNGDVKAGILGMVVGEIGQAFVGTAEVKAGLKAIKASEAAEIVNEIGILKAAVKGKGNFGVGEASANTSNKLGKAWVGDNSIVASDGKTMVSEDRLRQYRPPSQKNSSHATTGVQSNFEWRNKPKGQWQGNGHLNVTPPSRWERVKNFFTGN